MVPNGGQGRPYARGEGCPRRGNFSVRSVSLNGYYKIGITATATSRPDGILGFYFLPEQILQ